jgi:tetratricopeptide (TPR) repeat protein
MEYAIAQKQKKDKFIRYNDMEKAHSLFMQAINHLNVASALGQQVGVENNYLEFTTDDEKNLMDVMMDRALVYKELGELEVTKEESNNYYLLAAKEFANIIEKDATNYIAYFLCAECYAKADDHNQAISMYDSFLENLQDYVKQERNRGNSHIRAEELYIETRIKRALCAIKFTDFPLAQDDLQEVINLIADLLSHNEQSNMDRNLLLHYKAIAHNKLGYCFYRRYRYYDAIEQNTLALKLEPTFMEAYRDRCECYECLSLDKEADEDRRMVEYLKRKMAVEQ